MCHIKVPWHANFYNMLWKLVFQEVFWYKHPWKNEYFMSNINLEIRKCSPRYSFGDGDSLNLARDSPILTLTLLKLNAWSFEYKAICKEKEEKKDGTYSCQIGLELVYRIRHCIPYNIGNRSPTIRYCMTHMPHYGVHY